MGGSLKPLPHVTGPTLYANQTDTTPKTLGEKMGIRVNHIIPFLLLISTAADGVGSTAVSLKADGNDGDNQCVYTVYVRTGSVWKGGTDSIISIDLTGADGYGVRITDLEAWGGLMGDGYNYFERGNLDIFSGRGPCFSSPPCFINVTSDGSGPHHGWYLNYVEVTTTGPHVPCAQQLFTIEQWLATDASPYKLFAAQNNCPAPEEVAAAGSGGGLGRRGLPDHAVHEA